MIYKAKLNMFGRFVGWENGEIKIQPLINDIIIINDKKYLFVKREACEHSICRYCPIRNILQVECTEIIVCRANYFLILLNDDGTQNKEYIASFLPHRIYSTIFGYNLE